MSCSKRILFISAILSCLVLVPRKGIGLPSRSLKFEPNLSLLNTYSFALEGREPYKAPFLAEFQQDSSHLYFVASEHANLITSPTFQLISCCFEKLKINAVVLEGLPRKDGFSPPAVIKSFKESRNNGVFYVGGEPGFAGLLAYKHGIVFIGGELADKDIRKRLLATGYSPENILGFHFVVQVPQSKRNQTLAAKGVSAPLTTVPTGTSFIWD